MGGTDSLWGGTCPPCPDPPPLATPLDLLTSVELSEEIIIDSINKGHDEQFTCPDGLHASIFKNCVSDLVKPLKKLFESMFEENHIPSTLK